MTHVPTQQLEGVITIEMALGAAEDCARATSAGAVSAGRVQVGDSSGWLRALVGVMPELDALGYKVLLGAREGGARFVCQLFSLSDGRPLAHMDAAAITRLRTAAHAALAIERRFGGRKVSVGIVGSGHEAKQAARTLALRPGIDNLSVWSPREASRLEFARVIGEELNIEVRTAGSIGSCLSGVDVAYTATTSRGQVVMRADDLVGVPMLATIGSTTPRQREVAPEIFENAQEVVIDTYDCLTDSGDLLAHADDYQTTSRSYRLLGDYLAAPAGAVDNSLFVYKSIGSAEQDLYLAHRVMAALAAGESS